MLRRRAVSLLRTGLQSQQAGCRAADTAAFSELLAGAAAVRPQVQSRVWQQCHQQLRRQHGGWHSDNRRAGLAHAALQQTALLRICKHCAVAASRPLFCTFTQHAAVRVICGWSVRCQGCAGSSTAFFVNFIHIWLPQQQECFMDMD